MAPAMMKSPFKAPKEKFVSVKCKDSAILVKKLLLCLHDHSFSSMWRNGLTVRWVPTHTHIRTQARTHGCDT